MVFSLLLTSRSYLRDPEFVENTRLQEEEIEKINYEELIAENIRLRQIFDIKRDKDYLGKFAVADVVSIRPFVFPAELIINKGMRDGLKEGMAVLSKDLYLIGRILSVKQNTSSVITIFNSQSKISIITESTEEIGVLEGGSVPYVSLRYIPADSKVKIGDKILTSGYSDFYLKGIEIGEIEKIGRSSDSLFLKITVKPYGCLSGIYEVLVGE